MSTVLIAEEKVAVYMKADNRSAVLQSLAMGDEVTLGALKPVNGVDWVEARLSNGQQGYIASNTKICKVKKAVLLQNKVQVFAEPTDSSAVIATYQKDAELYLEQSIEVSSVIWVRIRDRSEKQGFILGNTQIAVVEQFPSDILMPTGGERAFGCMFGLVYGGLLSILIFVVVALVMHSLFHDVPNGIGFLLTLMATGLMRSISQSAAVELAKSRGKPLMRRLGHLFAAAHR